MKTWTTIPLRWRVSRIVLYEGSEVKQPNVHEVKFDDAKVDTLDDSEAVTKVYVSISSDKQHTNVRVKVDSEAQGNMLPLRIFCKPHPTSVNEQNLTYWADDDTEEINGLQWRGHSYGALPATS